MICHYYTRTSIAAVKQTETYLFFEDGSKTKILSEEPPESIFEIPSLFLGHQLKARKKGSTTK